MPAAVRGEAAAGAALRDEGFGFRYRDDFGRHWAAMATVPASGIGAISAGTGPEVVTVPDRRVCDVGAGSGAASVGDDF